MMSLNGELDRLHRLERDVNTFLVGKGRHLIVAEELETRLSETFRLVEELGSSSETEKMLSEQIVAADATLDEAERSLRDMSNRNEIIALRSVQEKLSLLRRQLLTTGLRCLGRPLRKLSLAIERGEFSILPEHHQSLGMYLEKPFTTFLSEEKGHSRLKAVLWNLEKALVEGKLGIKERKARKVHEQIDLVVNKGVLDSPHAKAKELFDERKRLLSNGNVRTTRAKILNLRREIMNLQQKKVDLQADQEKTVQQQQEVREKITKNLQRLQDLTLEIAGKRIEISIEANDPQEY
jgi:hypothetical protein